MTSHLDGEKVRTLGTIGRAKPWYNVRLVT